jgi:hypothetical protein
LTLSLNRADQFLEVVGRQLGVFLDALVLLHLIQDVLEQIALHAHDDVGVHLDETPVGIVGEARVAALAR